MAVFLHFGKEISDMMVKHISIEVILNRLKACFGGPGGSYCLYFGTGGWYSG